MAKTKITILLFLPLVLSLKVPTTVESSIEPPSTTEPPPETFDYIVKLIFGLQNDKIPEYLIDTIFDFSNNITVEDVIALYKLDTLNLTGTKDVLERLHYNPDNTLRIDGLERFLTDFGIDFKDLYNEIFVKELKISGLPLRTFLAALGINITQFSDAITFGVGDSFEIFKGGNFSEENLVNALQALNKSEDDIFIAFRDEILNYSKLKTRKEFFDILKTHNFDKVEALDLWDILSLDLDDADRVTVFSELLDQLVFDLENTTYLGVLTSSKVAVNKEVYEHIKDKLQLSKIFAQSLYENLTVELKEVEFNYKDIVTLVLETNNFTRFIESGLASKDLENCQIVTLENDTFTEETVGKVVNKGNRLEVSLNDVNITNLLQGSPLLCGDKVYGLAKEIDKENIVFNVFEPSGAGKILFNPFVFVICFVIYLKLQ